MSNHNENEVAEQTETRVNKSRARRRRTPLLVGIATIGGMALVVPQFLPASAEPIAAAASSSALADDVAPQPPAGVSWIQGLLTDQAGHRLNNVNVEAWPMDQSATQPVASNLTYATDPEAEVDLGGAFRLEVPAGTPYRITFSAVGGVEDGDKFRMRAYGGGRPIMTKAATGRIIDLGTTQLARQGTVTSKATARLNGKKVKQGRRGQVTVRVSSPYVTNVTGRVQVRVAGKKVSDRLAAFDHGRTTIRLPKLRPGRHTVSVMFQGSNTVAPSKANAVRLTVVKKRK